MVRLARLIAGLMLLYGSVASMCGGYFLLHGFLTPDTGTCGFSAGWWSRVAGIVLGAIGTLHVACATLFFLRPRPGRIALQCLAGVNIPINALYFLLMDRRLALLGAAFIAFNLAVIAILASANVRQWAAESPPVPPATG
jgi:hypothetical protein